MKNYFKNYASKQVFQRLEVGKDALKEIELLSNFIDLKNGRNN